MRSDEYSFYCASCYKTIRCDHQGLKDVKDHCNTVTHKRLLKTTKSQPSISQLFRPYRRLVEIYNHTEKDSKVFINEVTQVSNAQPGDCFFQLKDIPDEHSVQTLDDIIKETKSMDMVNFSAKVVSKELTQNASKNLQLAHCVVADTPSSFVRLVLWQQHIDMVTVDPSVHLQANSSP